MADAPAWVDGRTWYHVHALRAAGAPDVNADPWATEPTGRGLRALIGRLDHVADLGCSGLLLTPIATSSSHGYDAVDATRVDPRLGDDSDFDALVHACHERDLKLVLDGVLNHVGRAFPHFVDVLERGAASEAAGWFRIDFEADGEDGFGYRDFEGHRELVALNHRSADVLTWAVDVTTSWLDRGADGWRFDVAYAIPPSFLEELAQRVRRSHPSAFLFGEMIHGDYAGFVAASGLHGVTQYELHKACWSACNDRNLWELAWSLRRHAEMAASFVPVTFTGNHDVTRLATRLSDPAHLELVLAVLFTVPGTPCVYYGDEWAAAGTKVDGAGGDDAIRPRFDDLVADGFVEGRYRRWIAFRRDRPWLTRATLDLGPVVDDRLPYVVRAGTKAIAVSLDLDPGRGDPPWPTGDGWAAVDGLRGVWERGG
jgi:cyclomaltodextrinase / maltogenic alpha-amylase / neopullulanase